MWQAVQSFLDGFPSTTPARVPIVALVATNRDCGVLTDVAAFKELNIHFSESYDDARAAIRRLHVPLVIFDRDWPATDWRAAVRIFAAAPERPCVILLSGVADEYLWQELIRCGGYDVLTKPLRAEDTGRLLALALSYWRASVRPVTK